MVTRVSLIIPNSSKWRCINMSRATVRARICALKMPRFPRRNLHNDGKAWDRVSIPKDEFITPKVISLLEQDSPHVLPLGIHRVPVTQLKQVAYHIIRRIQHGKMVRPFPTLGSAPSLGLVLWLTALHDGYDNPVSFFKQSRNPALSDMFQKMILDAHLLIQHDSQFLSFAASSTGCWPGEVGTPSRALAYILSRHVYERSVTESLWSANEVLKVGFMDCVSLRGAVDQPCGDRNVLGTMAVLAFLDQVQTNNAWQSLSLLSYQQSLQEMHEFSAQIPDAFKETYKGPDIKCSSASKGCVSSCSVSSRYALHQRLLDPKYVVVSPSQCANSVKDIMIEQQKGYLGSLIKYPLAFKPDEVEQNLALITDMQNRRHQLPASTMASGPVVGPLVRDCGPGRSSSHTIAPNRIVMKALKGIRPDEVVNIIIKLEGGLTHTTGTGKGHLTDYGAITGILKWLGYHEDTHWKDDYIRYCRTGEINGIPIQIMDQESFPVEGDMHPLSMEVEIQTHNGDVVISRGASTGGGTFISEGEPLDVMTTPFKNEDELEMAVPASWFYREIQKDINAIFYDMA